MAHEFYLSSLETTREELALVDSHPFEVPNSDFDGWDLILGTEEERFTSMEDLKEVQQLTKAFPPYLASSFVQVIKLSFSLPP